MMMHLSRERTIFVCYRFFKQLLNRYGRKPIFTDGAQWYNDACKWLGLQHRMYGTELKNLMERFIQHIKDRTEPLDMGCLYLWHNKIFQIHVVFLFYHKKDIAKVLNASAAAAAAAAIGTRILTVAILEYILIIARFNACNFCTKP
jgi:transposase-like protein